MNEKMTVCKVCNKEIAKNASKCPYCGARRNVGKIIAAICFIIGISLIALDAIAGGNKAAGGAKSITNYGSTSVKEGLYNSTYQINEPIPFSSYEITVNKVIKRSVVGTEFWNSQASEDGMFIVVEFGFKNISNAPISIFSIPQILLVSPRGVKYAVNSNANLSYLTELELMNDLEGQINPNITSKNVAVFEVAKDDLNSEGWTLDIAGRSVQLDF